MAEQKGNFDLSYKILIVGNLNVGKTCLMYRFCEGRYYDSYISTIGIDCMSRTIREKDSLIRLQIWDTAGQERYRTLTQAYYRGANGIVLVYDVTQEKTFHDLAGWLSNIKEMAAPDVCKVMVGNKADNTVRQITRERGKQLADSFDIGFYEVSCKTNENVDEVFRSLARCIQTIQAGKKSLYLQTNSVKELPHSVYEDKKKKKCACNT